MSWQYVGAPYWILWTLWLVLGAIAVTGGLVAYRALRAYRSYPSRPHLLLGAGFLTLAVGMPALWMGMYAATENLLWCSLTATVGLLAGFVLVLLSVQTRRA